jgi:hypothetical protein
MYKIFLSHQMFRQQDSPKRLRKLTGVCMLYPDDHVLNSGCSEDLKSEVLIFDAGVTTQ